MEVELPKRMPTTNHVPSKEFHQSTNIRNQLIAGIKVSEWTMILASSDPCYRISTSHGTIHKVELIPMQSAIADIRPSTTSARAPTNL